MKTKKGIGKPIRKAKRGKHRISGKDAAAGAREDPPEDGPEEIGQPEVEEPKPDRMANWAQGEARIVQVGDRALIKLAAAAVKGAAKRAKQINAGLDIAKGQADDRTNQAEAILQATKGTDNRADVTIASHLLRCAQIGLSFLIEKGVKLRDSEVEDVGCEDTRTMDDQLRTLERLARDLGMQGDLGIDREEKEAEEPEAELELEEQPA
jgi:hypothetical protein